MPTFEPPVYTLKGIKIRFGSKQLFEDVELYINRGDKISLVGRNGSGKSTLLKIIAGLIEPDDGEIFIQPNTKIGYMPQDADLSAFKTLREVVASGLKGHDGSEDYKTYGSNSWKLPLMQIRPRLPAANGARQLWPKR